MEVEEIIKAITIQVLAMFYKKVIIFVSGGVVNIAEEFEVLKQFNNLKYSLVLSDCAKSVIPKQFIESLKGDIIEDKKILSQRINEADFILIPVMTRNMLSKTAVGIRDTFITTGISEAIMKNKKIIAVKDSFDPQNPVNISLGYSQNVAYNKMLENHMKTLESFGVSFINAFELKKSIGTLLCIQDSKLSKVASNNKVKLKDNSQATIKGIVTKSDLLRLGECKNLKLFKRVVITPLAKDYIDSENIKIDYLD